MDIKATNINFSAQKLVKSRNNLAFGYKVYVDTGASDPVRGSFKVRIASDDGRKLLLDADQLPESLQKVGTPSGFKTGKDYTEGLSRNIAKSIELVKDKVAGLGEKLSGIVINAPCYVKNNYAETVANIIGAEKVDFNDIKNNLKRAGIELSEESFKLVALNDLAGAAAGIAKMMANHPESKEQFKDGFFGSIWMTGGGTGVADIKVKNGVLEIETSESGHNMAINSKKGRSIEKEGGSSPALIRNYCETLGMKEEDIAKLLQFGKAKFTTCYPLKEDTGSDAEKAFLNTGLFIKEKEVINSEGRKKSILKMPNVGKKEHDKASKKAINKYIATLAQMASNKILEGANCVILTGPLAMKVIENVNSNPEKWEGKTFDQVAMEKTKEMLDQAGVKLVDIHKFKFVHDFVVPDNTVGGELLLKEGTSCIGAGIRGNWINMPVENVKS